MNNEQAYINGFVKRANEYGVSEAQAIQLLKSAEPQPGFNWENIKSMHDDLDDGNRMHGAIGNGLAWGLPTAVAGYQGLRNVGNNFAKNHPQIMDAVKGVGQSYKDVREAVNPSGSVMPSLIRDAATGIGTAGLSALRGANHVAGNFVANHPKLEQGLQNYTNNYNTAMDATKGGGPSLLRPMLRPIAANLAAAHEAINPAVK